MFDRDIKFIGFGCFSSCSRLGSFAIESANVKKVYTRNICTGNTYVKDIDIIKYFEIHLQSF